MNNLLFLDTEFSNLGPEPKLISIGLVSHKSGDCFYAEVPPETYQESCSAWVRQHVLPLLEGGERVMSFDKLSDRLAQWIDNQKASKIVSDYPKYDFTFLKALLDPWPSQLEASPEHFSLSDASQLRPNLMQKFCDDYYSLDKPQHHALNDAKALRQIWLLCAQTSDH